MNIVKGLKIPTGVRNLGRRKIDYTPEIILSILVAIASFNKWSERIEFIEERHPELKGLLKRKNLKQHSEKNGWYKLVKAAQAEAMDAEGIKDKTKQLFETCAEGELETVEDLHAERERIRAAIKLLDVGSKEYTAAMSALKTANDMIARMSGLDRMRRKLELKDAADIGLEVTKEKLKLAGKGGDFGSSPFDIEQEPKLLGQDEDYEA